MPSSLVFASDNGRSPIRSVASMVTELLPSSEAMLYAAERQIARIRERTSQGRDVNGAMFAPYSAAYAKRRARKGRATSPVDLLMSGRMLNSLRPEVRSSTSFAITIQDSTAAVYGIAHNTGTSRLPQRRWFDISSQELDAMRDDLFSFDRK